MIAVDPYRALAVHFIYGGWLDWISNPSIDTFHIQFVSRNEDIDLAIKAVASAR